VNCVRATPRAVWKVATPYRRVQAEVQGVPSSEVYVQLRRCRAQVELADSLTPRPEKVSRKARNDCQANPDRYQDHERGALWRRRTTRRGHGAMLARSTRAGRRGTTHSGNSESVFSRQVTAPARLLLARCPLPFPSAVAPCGERWGLLVREFDERSGAARPALRLVAGRPPKRRHGIGGATMALLEVLNRSPLPVLGSTTNE
jgi:hypothetical protein